MTFSTNQKQHQSKASKLMEANRITSPIQDHVDVWLTRSQESCESIHEAIVLDNLTVEGLANFLKSEVITELNDNLTYSLGDRLARMALKYVDWKQIAQSYLNKISHN